MNWQCQLLTIESTDRLAAALAQHASVPMMLALFGPLGVGKTQLVRSLATHLGVPAELVTSPTYVLVQKYRGRIEMFHLDFYRLKSIDEVWDLGLDEWLDQPVLTVIEWADKFRATWPEEYVSCEMSIQEDGSRRASFFAQGPSARSWLERTSRTLQA